MYTSIVVPLDGSAFGKRALPVALALASRSDAAVHLVHVQEPIVHPGGGPMYDTRLHNELQREAQADLAAVAEQLSRETSLRISAEFLEGPVTPTLQAYLADGRHDLVVMMTHGRGGLSRAWLGSVADGLLRHTPLPLLLVRPGAEWAVDLGEPLFRHVLVPLDGSAMADEVLDHAVSLATPHVTVYTLLKVVAPLPLLGRPFPNAEGFNNSSNVDHERDAAQLHLANMAKELRVSGVLVETVVVTHPQPAQGILDVAEQQHVDAIALSTHGRGRAARFLIGSVADKVVRGATVPVLVYRPESARAESAERGNERAIPATGATVAMPTRAAGVGG